MMTKKIYVAGDDDNNNNNCDDDDIIICDDGSVCDEYYKTLPWPYGDTSRGSQGRYIK